MRIHRVIVEPSGTIEYRITDTEAMQDPYRKHVHGHDEVDLVVEALRAALTADIRDGKIA